MHYPVGTEERLSTIAELFEFIFDFVTNYELNFSYRFYYKILCICSPK